MSHAEPLEARTHLAASVVGYLPDYETAAAIARIDWGSLTRVEYFSAVPSAKTGELPATSSAGSDWSQLADVVKTAKAHGVAVSIVIGGGDGFDATLTGISSNAKLRDAFAESVATFTSKYGVDGVDFDWEPAAPTAQQREDYATLIHGLHVRGPSLHLSAAVNAEPLRVGASDRTAYVLTPGAVRDLEAINVMAYDLDYADVAPIERSERDLDAWCAYVTANGGAKSKLIFGLPLYARAGTSWKDTQAVSYSAIVDAYVKQNGTALPADATHAKLRFAGLFGNHRVTWHFDGQASAVAKTRYAIDHGYGGVMLWSLGQDRFVSGKRPARYSLLTAIGAATHAEKPQSVDRPIDALLESIAH